MASANQTIQQHTRNGLWRPLPPTPFNNEQSHQPHHAAAIDPPINAPRSSQRNKYSSMAPDSIPPNLKRRSSRFGLSSLFSRSKPIASEGVQDKLGVQWECDESEGTITSANAAGPRKNDPQSLSPKSQSLPRVDFPATPLRNRASKSALGSRSSFKRETTSRSSSVWEPPPLFQAYPQAVRHATLRTPTISAETILRLNVERNSNMNQRGDSYTPEVNTLKVPKEKKLRRPSPLGVLSKGDWTDKTFILVTSGYILQYAGQGLFDRLPEKAMPLSKESAAFASDAIPGKPYVLQVSQVSNEDGTLDMEASRSMFKGLGLRSQMKRPAPNFLLVFESPEELSAWMAAVRKEIEAMGGKAYRPDEFRKPAELEPSQELHQRPSQRYLVVRDPNRFAQIPGPQSDATLGNNSGLPKRSTQAEDPVDPASIKRQSMATQQSIDSRTTSNTVESVNQMNLDRLRESPRQSYASTEGKTTATSRDSSPGSSPVNIHVDIPQWAPNLNERRQTTSMYHGVARSSVQQLTVPNNVRRESTTSPPAPSSHRVSTYAPQQKRTSSPAAPNFSVPTFSKRYSSVNTSPASGTTSTPQTPPLSLVHVSPSPPVIDEEEEGTKKPASIIGELQHLRKPNPRVSNGLCPSISTPPRSAGSCGPPSSAESDRPFSRRYSSLEYARGVSPLQLASQSPSPHPAPTAPLPAIPGANVASRTSCIKPPLFPLPPVQGAEESRASSTTPTAPTTLLAFPLATPSPRTFITPSPSPSPTTSQRTESPSRNFPYPPPTKAAVPDVNPSSRISIPPSPPKTPSDESTAHKPTRGYVMPEAEESKPVAAKTEVLHQSSAIHIPTTEESTETTPTRVRCLRRPVSMQVRIQPPIKHATPPQSAYKTTFDLDNITPPPVESLPSPPKPTRNPPPPPSDQRPKLIVSKSSPRIGREPPPVSALPSPRSRISVISPATSYFDEAAPHPFIPPINVSEGRFRGSLDGPWNAAYGAPQRNFLDLGAI